MDKVKYYKKIFLTPGIVSYKDKGDGVLLIQKETIDKALETIKEKDVVITHDSTEPVGKIVDAYYDTNEGAFVCGLNIWDAKAQDLLDNQNYSISCFYNILDEGEGGIYHNIKYNNEAKVIEFVNIAIVDRPRYQEARKVINSITNNDGEEMSIINKIKNSLSREDNKAKDVEIKEDKKKEAEKEEDAKANSEEIAEKYHQKDLNDIYTLLDLIAKKTGCYDKENEVEDEEEEDEVKDDYEEKDDDDEDDEEKETVEEEEEVKNEVKPKPIKKDDEVEDDDVEESKFEKYQKEKKVKRPIANSINNSISSYRNEPFEYKNRRDRIKESNKKFYNND